jgi:hypothetical protein
MTDNKKIINEDFKRLQRLAGIIKEQDESHSGFKYNTIDEFLADYSIGGNYIPSEVSPEVRNFAKSHNFDITKMIAARNASKEEEFIQPTDELQEEKGELGIDWEKVKLLQVTNKLKGRWKVIMAAVDEAGGKPENALALLKSAVAALELHKNKTGASSEEMASTEEMTRMDDMF